MTLLSAADLKGVKAFRQWSRWVALPNATALNWPMLPEADAVLGFDAYADIGRHVRRVLGGERPAAHVPRDRRRLLPLAPIERQSGLAR